MLSSVFQKDKQICTNDCKKVDFHDFIFQTLNIAKKIIEKGTIHIESIRKKQYNHFIPYNKSCYINMKSKHNLVK